MTQRPAFKWVGLMLAACLVQSASATNILAFGTPGRPDQYSWQQFYGQSDNTASKARTDSLLNIWSYYTPTGFTGTTRDQFQYSLRGTVGYAHTTAGTTNGFALSAPGLSAQYYYNIIQPGQTDKMDPEFRTWWTNPQVTLNLPDKNRQASGFGSGANQWSLNLQDNNYIAIGRFGISINPISATYDFKDDTPTVGAATALKRGLNLTLLDTAAGYWVTPNLIAGLQFQLNRNALATSDVHLSSSARVGPAFTYLGFKDKGFFIAGNVARDFHDDNFTHNAARTTTYQIWIQKYFKGS